MTNTVEVSYLLLDASIQSLERLIHEAEEVDPDDQLVLEELRALMLTNTESSSDTKEPGDSSEAEDAKEESSETEVEEDQEYEPVQ
jgi:hypothetical protein